LKNRVESLRTVREDEEEPRRDYSIDCAGELFQALRIRSQEAAIPKARALCPGSGATEEAF
jgi:hypothetical protein